MSCLQINLAEWLTKVLCGPRKCIKCKGDYWHWTVMDALVVWVVKLIHPAKTLSLHQDLLCVQLAATWGLTTGIRRPSTWWGSCELVCSKMLSMCHCTFRGWWAARMKVRTPLSVSVFEPSPTKERNARATSQHAQTATTSTLGNGGGRIWCWMVTIWFFLFISPNPTFDTGKNTDADGNTPHLPLVGKLEACSLV